MRIVVAPRSAVAQAAGEHRPVHAISLRSPGADIFGLAGLAEERQLHLVMNDIAEDREGLVSPTIEHVTALLDFGMEVSGTLLIHCYAGISRSTAAAFILAAARLPQRDEAELAATLRALCPMATPNPYLIRLADGRLGRDGRMVRAIAGIGRGAEAYEGVPFVWSLDSTEPTG